MLAFTCQCIHINRIVAFQTSSDLWRSSDMMRHSLMVLSLFWRLNHLTNRLCDVLDALSYRSRDGGERLILVTSLAWRNPPAITHQSQSSRPRMHWLQGSLMLCPQASSTPTDQSLMTQLRYDSSRHPKQTKSEAGDISSAVPQRWQKSDLLNVRMAICNALPDRSGAAVVMYTFGRPYRREWHHRLTETTVPRADIRFEV